MTKYFMRDCKHITARRRYLRKLLILLNSRVEP